MNSEDYLLSKLISEALLPPAISTLGIQVNQPGFRFGNHVYDNQVEIVYVLHGGSYVGIDKQFIRIKKNDCLIIFPASPTIISCGKTKAAGSSIWFFHPGICLFSRPWI